MEGRFIRIDLGKAWLTPITSILCGIILRFTSSIF